MAVRSRLSGAKKQVFAWKISRSFHPYLRRFLRRVSVLLLDLKRGVVHVGEVVAELDRGVLGASVITLACFQALDLGVKIGLEEEWN